MTMKIGVGVTTRNRPGRAVETLQRIADVTPLNADLLRMVVVDDASDEPVVGADHRFETNVGIARAKNKCLELLDDCDHIFLFDDDAYPIVEDWWKPYVESPEPHLMYQFADLAGPRKLRDIGIVYRDSQHVAYTGPRGVMLYVDAKKILPVVGGMDPIYGKWGFEHGDWSNRIYFAGLTSWRHADVAGSEKLIHSMDEHGEIARSVGGTDRKTLAAKNGIIHDQRRDSRYTAYVDYRERQIGGETQGDRDVVITHLYSSKPDPQRPQSQLAQGIAPAYELMNSLRCDVVIIGDNLEAVHPPPTVEIVKAEWAINVFFQRHLDSWRYLRDHPEIRYAWCVDATDVEMVNDPFPHMEPGTIYVGYEPVNVSTDWLRKNHPTKRVQQFVRSHPTQRLLNAGVIGGDRETLMAYLHDMIRYYEEGVLRRWLKQEATAEDLGDMGAMQVVGWDHRDHLVTGPKVVSKFKAFEKLGSHWWRHK